MRTGRDGRPCIVLLSKGKMRHGPAWRMSSKRESSVPKVARRCASYGNTVYSIYTIFIYIFILYTFAVYISPQVQGSVPGLLWHGPHKQLVLFPVELVPRVVLATSDTRRSSAPSAGSTGSAGSTDSTGSTRSNHVLPSIPAIRDTVTPCALGYFCLESSDNIMSQNSLHLPKHIGISSLHKPVKVIQKNGQACSALLGSGRCQAVV